MLRRLFVGALFALTMITPAAVTTAATNTAPIGVQSNLIVRTYYYSDATYTTQVGYTFENFCTGRSWTTGTVTPYYQTESEWCYA